MTGCQCAAGLAKRNRQPFTPKASIKQPTDLTNTHVSGRKNENLEKIHACTGRMCRVIKVPSLEVQPVQWGNIGAIKVPSKLFSLSKGGSGELKIKII